MPAPDEPIPFAPPSWNAPPGISRLLMHCWPDHRPHLDSVNWGYRPAWAAEKRIPAAINARIEKAATGRYFAPLWRRGRAIVPVDGWFEWTGKTGQKQPWYIHQKSERPMFVAAVAKFRHAAQLPQQPGTMDGFVIVTAAAEAGLVDVHDRRPVVLAAADALAWLDPELSSQQAEYLARAMCLPADAFAWHPVSRQVNRAGNDGAAMIEPVDPTPPAPTQGTDESLPQLF